MDSNVFVGLCLLGSAFLISYIINKTTKGRLVNLKTIVQEYSGLIKTTFEMYKRYVNSLASIDYNSEDNDDIVDKILVIKKDSLISALTMTEMTFVFRKGTAPFDLINAMIQMFDELQMSCDYSLKYLVSFDDFYRYRTIDHLEKSADIYKKSLEKFKRLKIDEEFVGLKF